MMNSSKQFLFLVTLLITSNLEADQTSITGSWTFSSVANFDGVVGAYTESEINKHLGKTIEYVSKWIRFEQREFRVADSVSEYWSSEDLYKETSGTGSTGIDFRRIGFSGREIEIIQLKANNFRMAGAFLILLSRNKMLTLYNGVYYWLERNKEK